MKTCFTCEFFVSRQTGRANSKGTCYRYPISEKLTAGHRCGEYRPAKVEVPFGGRPQLMKQLKAAGVKVDIKWTVNEMESKLEEANEKQKAETANGQSEETEGSH